MLNRHVGAVGPISVGGRLFVQGVDSVQAYDSYNGLFLWEHKNPGAIRTGVFNNHETSNLAATDDTLYVAAKDTVTAYDAATSFVKKSAQQGEEETKEVFVVIRSWRQQRSPSSMRLRPLVDCRHRLRSSRGSCWATSTVR